MPVIQSKPKTVKQALAELKPVADSLVKRRAKPLWDGPCSDGPQGGITQSLLGAYLVCKERARIGLIEGLREPDSFSHRMEYGNLWHLAEELYANGEDMDAIYKGLLKYVQRLKVRYPNQQPQIIHWFRVCTAQFPVYIDYWKNHKDIKKREPIYQEKVFHEAYILPSGRTVYLRGKYDSVDRVGSALVLQENKARGEIDVEQIKGQLRFDLQTMFYLNALSQDYDVLKKGIKSYQVRFNPVKRPLSGGKHSIKQKKGQTEDEFYKELSDRIRDNPGDFFFRFNVEVLSSDLTYFRNVCLNPILENAADDYEWWEFCYTQGRGMKKGGLPLVWDYGLRSERFPHHQSRHYVLPFGIYNPLIEGGTSHLDHYLLTGDERGLERASSLFRELENESTS